MKSSKTYTLLIALAVLFVSGCGDKSPPTDKPVGNSGSGNVNPQQPADAKAQQTANQRNQNTK